MASGRLPYRFPSAAEQLRARAEEFQRLPPGERFAAMLDLIGSGAKLLAQSSRREAAERLRAEHEEAWRQRMKELFARHGL